MEKYVAEFGEFRKKKLLQQKKAAKSDIKCKICNENMMTHNHLMYHIRVVHKVYWEDYIIKYIFKGVHPLCKCGCGEKVKLLQAGQDDDKNKTYARSYLMGHNRHSVGYRKASLEQRQNMRRAALKRMERKDHPFYKNGPSKGETELQEYVGTLTSEVELNNMKILAGLELDIVLPDQKIAIEYNGDYFHSDLFKDRKYHLKKTEECEELGYRLIQVWEHDWIKKPAIVKSILKSIIGKSEQKYYARTLKVVEISANEKSHFLSQNHLQGDAVGKVHLALKNNNDILAVMSFSSLRAATGQVSRENCYELLRFCSALNTTVVGGASKLFSYFIRNYNPKYILSYANRDWSVGGLYEKLGFTYVGVTAPDYFYVKSKYRYSRFQFQKHKLIAAGYDASKTEYEIMTERGFLRIWGSGNLKFEWNS